MVKYNQKRCEYSQKPLDHAKQSATDGFESAPKRAVQKTAETTSDLIGNKIANKIIKVLKKFPQNNSETNEEEIHGERYISPELRWRIIDDLRKKIKGRNLLLDNTPNQPTEFRIKNLVKINDKSRGMYNTNSQIRFKTSMLRTSLCDYSDAYIFIKGTITVLNTAAAGADANSTNK